MGQHPGLPVPAFDLLAERWLVKAPQLQAAHQITPQGVRGEGRITKKGPCPGWWPGPLGQPQQRCVRERTRNPRWGGVKHALCQKDVPPDRPKKRGCRTPPHKPMRVS